MSLSLNFPSPVLVGWELTGPSKAARNRAASDALHQVPASAQGFEYL